MNEPVSMRPLHNSALHPDQIDMLKSDFHIAKPAAVPMHPGQLGAVVSCPVRPSATSLRATNCRGRSAAHGGWKGGAKAFSTLVRGGSER